MRAELKQILNSPHVPDEYDLSRTLHIAQNLNSGRHELASKHQHEVEKQGLTEEQLWAYADDIHWYAFEETFFIWHFCLWRLQAIFESIISSRFLDPNQHKSLRGLKARLTALRKEGYKIEDEDFKELLEWGKIRNQFSHFPPSSHGIGPLEQSDIIEYHDLCRKICAILTNQKEARSLTSRSS